MTNRNSSQRRVFLMRGLPSCGKSHMARRLAGKDGIVLETDEYFFHCVGDDPTSYDYRAELLPRARKWLFERFVHCMRSGTSPIVIDRGNARDEMTRRLAKSAVDHGYEVSLQEPDSPWWQELRVLLKYRQYLDPEVLDIWAERLAEMNRETHRVPQAEIRERMQSWIHDLRVESILAIEESRFSACDNEQH